MLGWIAESGVDGSLVGKAALVGCGLYVAYCWRANKCPIPLGAASSASSSGTAKREMKKGKSISEVSPAPQRGFTATELAEYNGARRPDIYISLKGIVFEVAPQYYGPGEAYHCFAGKEASRDLAKSHIGDTEANADWTVNLNAHQLKVLDSWFARFESKYPVVGWFVADDEYRRKGQELTDSGY